MKPHALLAGLAIVFLAPAHAPRAMEDTAKSAADARPGVIRQTKPPFIVPGHTWQLVEIVSMDDRVDVPDNRALYTVEFKTDGAVQVRADCNRGAGTWTSTGPSQLQFGEIAATQAQCLPGSLHESYMAQFPWVRSYVMKDGHLFLATMADGSIIEFEPVELPLAAMVLGEEIRTSDASDMQEVLLTRLFNRYAEKHGIQVTEAEIDSFVENMRRGMSAMGLTGEDDLTEEETAQLKQMRRDMGRSMIRHWKMNRALYRQYGGRIIYQQLGPEPLDAYRRYIEERRDAGDFTIQQKTFEDAFWRYFTTDSIHDFYDPGSEEEIQAFSKPPWEHAGTSPERIVQPSCVEDVSAAADDGGPVNWQISGASGGLNLRAKPSTSSDILATYPSGTILDNLGCLRTVNRVWCDVQSFGGGPRGYVAAEFLAPAAAPDGLEKNAKKFPRP